MKKALMLVAIFAVVGIVINGCKKKDTIVNDIQPTQKIAMQDEMIPIAKLTDKNEIKHLFLQKDVQEFFSKENPDAKLVFVEVINNEKKGNEAGLLYRIYYGKRNVTETSLTLTLILQNNIYYYLPSGGGSGSGWTTSCTTKDCASESDGCVPKMGGGCTPCKNGGDCTRTTSNVASIALTNAIHYAVSVYKFYGQN
ncbi:MAG: hypothetical protein LBK94_08795 [Prevotellaceae bacterium]|nr:hypothetical protein [Prevotellaceae bacterium]